MHCVYVSEGFDAMVYMSVPSMIGVVRGDVVFKGILNMCEC